MKKFYTVFNRKSNPFYFLTLFLCLLGANLNAQNLDSKGTDFWLAFPGNFLGGAQLSFFITGDENTSGTVSIPGLGFSAPFTVTAGAITTFTVPATADLGSGSNVVTSKGIHVTAAKEVTIYGLSRIQATTDAYLALPTDILGTSYINLGYKNSNIVNGTQFAIVATENSTTVTITLNIATDGRAAGVPYNVTLQQGQTYQVRNATAAPADLSGTLITSNKPIAVYGSHQCANIPPGAVACDFVVEQLPPNTAWGKNFVTVPLKTRRNGDSFRFMAQTNGTEVRVNGAVVANLNKGQLHEMLLLGASQVTANEPILVAQYSNGTSFDNVTSDPFMMLIPPFEQYLGNYTIATPATGFRFNFVNVVAPNAAVGAIRLDGTLIPSSGFTAIGSTGFSYAQLDLTVGNHTVNGTNLPFGVFVYGFDNADSYGYPGGQSLAPIASATSIVLTPTSGNKAVNTEQCFEARVRDQFNNPVVGTRVDFNITGPNASKSGFANTNASGIARFCYTGEASGTDNIVASLGTLSSSGTFRWDAVASNVYYSKATGNLHVEATWGVNPDGSGANPTDFGAGKTFNLANRASGIYAMTANWTVAGTINIPSGSQLQIGSNTLSRANTTGNGTITGSTTSNMIITGVDGDAGLLRFTAGAGSSLWNLTLNRTGTNPGATLGTTLSIHNVLTVTSGTFKTENRLTLKSSATATARVAPVLGNITGNVTVERYIPARRAWRIMSAPVNGTQTIKQAWQEGALTTTSNPNPGFGTHITAGTVANGFDQNPGSVSSLKSYNSATDAWVHVPNTNATTVGNKALMLFVRGNRGITMADENVVPNNTVLRASGPLKIGDQPYNVSATGFTAVPNPYASPLDFSKITRTNVPNSFYLWDPKMGGTHGVGAYVNVSFNGTSYDVTPASVSPESQFIQSGQGFLVRSSGGVAGNLLIKEADKSATAATDVFGANTGSDMVDNSKGLRVSLQLPGSDNKESLLDEVYSSYGGFSNKIDDFDAIKIENFRENLAIVRSGQKLMVERKAFFNDADTIQLNLWNAKQNGYMFEFNPINLSSSVSSALLVDNYLKTSTTISTTDISQVYFNISDAESANPARFQVILSTRAPQQNGPVGVSRISAYPNPIVGSNINLQFVNATRGTYRVEVVNSIGQLVFRKDLQHPGGTATQVVQLNSVLSKGVYQLKVRGEESNSVIKIISNQ